MNIIWGSVYTIVSTVGDRTPAREPPGVNADTPSHQDPFRHDPPPRPDQGPMSIAA
jgi:hypothetical protein